MLVNVKRPLNVNQYFTDAFCLFSELVILSGGAGGIFEVI